MSYGSSSHFELEDHLQFVFSDVLDQYLGVVSEGSLSDAVSLSAGHPKARL